MSSAMGLACLSLAFNQALSSLVLIAEPEISSATT